MIKIRCACSAANHCAAIAALNLKFLSFCFCFQLSIFICSVQIATVVGFLRHWCDLGDFVGVNFFFFFLFFFLVFLFLGVFLICCVLLN